MKIYLASRYKRRKELQRYRDQLKARGHKVTARWLDGGAELKRQECAIIDRDDVLKADAVISFTEDRDSAPKRKDLPSWIRGGRHVEYGIALATGKRLMIVGPRENIFHHLPGVEVFPSWDALLTAI